MSKKFERELSVRQKVLENANFRCEICGLRHLSIVLLNPDGSCYPEYGWESYLKAAEEDAKGNYPPEFKEAKFEKVILQVSFLSDEYRKYIPENMFAHCWRHGEERKNEQLELEL